MRTAPFFGNATARRTGAIAALIAVAAATAFFAYRRQNDPENPDSGAIHFDAGIAALDRGDLRSAYAEFRRLEELSGTSRQKAILAAGILLRRDRPAEALADLARIESGGPHRFVLLRFMGEALYRLGRIVEAESCFRRLLSEQPDDPAAHRWLAAVCFDLGVMDESESHLIRLTGLAPSDYMPHRMLGLIHQDFEQYAAAAGDFRAALDRSPPAAVRAELAKDLAVCLMRERQFGEALDALNEAGEAGECDALRSECLWSLGRKEEAESALNRARKRAPDSLPVLRWHALSLVNDGRTEEAIIALERVLAIDPNHVECRYQLALANRRLGRLAAYESHLAKTDRSKELLDRLTRLSSEAMQRPHDAELRERMADVCDELGRGELATSWRRSAEALRRAEASRSDS